MRHAGEYPEQALWHFMGIAKSKVKQRKQRAGEVLEALHRKGSSSARLAATQSESIFDALIKLALRQSSAKSRKMDVSSILGKLRRIHLTPRRAPHQQPRSRWPPLTML